jgi:hypothetical protein
VLIGQIGADWFLVRNIFTAQSRRFGTPAAAGCEGHQQQRPVAQVDQPITGAGAGAGV